MELVEIKDLVTAGKRKQMAAAVQGALDAGATPDDILNCMVGAMGDVGEMFSRGEIFVPEMLMSAKAMSAGMDVIKPLLAGEGAENSGECIIGTVKGDLHDIGKNLVATMIEAAGFDLIDLGVDVPIETFIQTIKDNPDVKLVALSALLTSTMQSMRDTAKAINEIKGDYSFKLLVGGAPITEAFAEEVGADGYALDAGLAAAKAKELCK